MPQRRDCTRISSRQTVEERITRVLVIFNPRRDTYTRTRPSLHPFLSPLPSRTAVSIKNYVSAT